LKFKKVNLMMLEVKRSWSLMKRLLLGNL